MERYFYPSGGLTYHYNSLKYSWNLWRKARKELLLRLPPLNDEKIVLIGPSGGYLLESNWLERFESVIAFDPDPLSKTFFNLAHPRLKTIEHKKLYVDFSSPTQFINDLKSRQFDPEKSCILFCNLLGQMAIDQQFDMTCAKNFIDGLSQFNLISFHEEFSGQIFPHTTITQRKLFLSAPVNVENLARMSRNNTIRDHQTETLFDPHEKSSYFYWPLTPRSLHLMVVGFKPRK
ncbi:MAG: hypothetical protein R2827_07060 [Bdellovibrionales bacterium]